jgi:hypothetical protein
VDADLDTLATGLYVTSDDFLADNPQYRPLRPRVGRAPRLTDAELVTLVVLQALLGFTSEARFPRYANTHLRGLFPYLPTQSGYNKRIRAAIGTLRAVIAHLVARTSSVSDDVWVVDSTPVECGRSPETAKRSDLAGWAEYGYCGSHSRFFWGCVCTWCARCRVCRWRSRWPAPRPTNARSCSACSTPTRIWWPPTRIRS